jgi:hypothetical protein
MNIQHVGGGLMQTKVQGCHNRWSGQIQLYCSIHLLSAPRGYTKDEGRPLEAGLQEQASNRLKLRW